LNAVDTNVLARYIVQDDGAQSENATAILAEPCFVSDTVLLETAWLLSSRYGVRRADLAATLLDVLRLPALVVSDDGMIAWAIERFAEGADLADMLHVASARHADRFVTFNARLARQAGAQAPILIETLD
jgi:predicted nucleic-acid-binding protein